MYYRQPKPFEILHPHRLYIYVTKYLDKESQLFSIRTIITHIVFRNTMNYAQIFAL